MGFEWDSAKAKSNLRKHGIDLAEAVTALEDDNALTVEDGRFDDERRWVTLGMDALGRLIVVVYVWRDESIRIISARWATPREREQYEEST